MFHSSFCLCVSDCNQATKKKDQRDRQSVDPFFIMKEGDQLTNEELVSLIQQGNNVSENMGILYQENIGLIKKVILPFSEYAEMDDLMQEAYFGLVDAVEHYIDSYDTKFMTYAPYRIRLHCVRYVENFGRTKRIPVHMLQLINKYKKLVAECGDLDADSVKQELHMSTKQYNLMIQTILESDCISLDAVMKVKDENLTVGDTIPDNIDIEQEVLEKKLCEDLWKQVDSLDEKKKFIIQKHFADDQELSQIANDLGVSRQRIHQLEKKALEQLRQLQMFQELAESYGYDCSLSYRTGLQAMKDGKGSNVERLVMKRIELEERCNRENVNLGRLLNVLSGSKQNSMLDRINDLCKMKGISRRKMEEEAGLGIGATSKWKNGFQPRLSSLQKVADFFEVSVEYLKGCSDEKV